MTFGQAAGWVARLLLVVATLVGFVGRAALPCDAEPVQTASGVSSGSGSTMHSASPSSVEHRVAVDRFVGIELRSAESERDDDDSSGESLLHRSARLYLAVAGHRFKHERPRVVGHGGLPVGSLGARAPPVA